MKKETLVTSDSKRMASSSYRKKVKRFTEMVKSLRGIGRIPNTPKRPANDIKKQEAYDKAFATTVDKETVHFWLHSYSFDDARRSVMAAPSNSGGDSKPTDSVKY